MLEVVVVVWLCNLLQNTIINKPLANSIKQVQSIEEANRLRQIVKKRRLILLLCFLFSYVSYLVFINIVFPGPYDQLMYSITGIGIVIFRYVKDKKFESLIGNISTWNKDDFLSNNKRYVLFLRGFASDNYSSVDVLNKKVSSDCFSEYLFVRILNQKIRVCAIGMSKEVDAPVGATRIYVNDGTWKEDVRELMEVAQYIYILVDDRPSCVWEIYQSEKMLDKTLFLVDNKTKYKNARNFLVNEYGKSFLPEIPSNISSDFVAISINNDNPIFTSYGNTPKGYGELLGLKVPKDLNVEENEKKKKRAKGCLLFILVLWGLIICFYIIGCLVSKFTIERTNLSANKVVRSKVNGDGRNIELVKLGDEKQKQNLQKQAEFFYNTGMGQYWDGRGIEQIEKLAYCNLRLASELGHKKAEEMIKRRIWVIDKEKVWSEWVESMQTK